ncbi:hypothetical protein TNCV_3771571 [Trichonephila clavipes]|nr:hypothetical protein TNCV_3771571 [Trichonephila clavipes]
MAASSFLPTDLDRKGNVEFIRVQTLLLMTEEITSALFEVFQRTSLPSLESRDGSGRSLYPPITSGSWVEQTVSHGVKGWRDVDQRQDLAI